MSKTVQSHVSQSQLRRGALWHREKSYHCSIKFLLSASCFVAAVLHILFAPRPILCQPRLAVENDSHRKASALLVQRSHFRFTWLDNRLNWLSIEGGEAPAKPPVSLNVYKYLPPHLPTFCSTQQHASISIGDHKLINTPLAFIL
jgi:hypothetical protein